MELLAGRATASATAAFAGDARRQGKVHPEHFRRAPDDLTISSIGLGTYLGPADARTDRAVEEAVVIAVTSGRVNLIDTAINYRGQRAERAIGRALQRVVGRQGGNRAALVIATKAGYLAPDAEAEIDASAWIERELIAPGHLDPASIVDGSHAMGPAYLADQFERSRTNLGLAHLDVVYLHNAVEAQQPTIGPAALDERMGAAFEQFERWRRAGTLGAYGLATWDALRVPPSDPRHASLERLVGLARSAGGDLHGFRYVQLPFNLAMPEAGFADTQRVAGERCTPFEAARKLGVACVTSVPLLQGRLARPRDGVRTGLTPAQDALQFARSAPGALAALVGQKTPDHLAEDLAVAGMAPWPAADVAARLS